MHMCYERPGVVTALNGSVGYDKWDRDRGGGGGGGGGGGVVGGGTGVANSGVWAGRDRERDRERERQARANQMSQAHAAEPDASTLFSAPFRVTGNRDRVSQQIQTKLGDYHLAQCFIDDQSIGICAEPPSPAPCPPSRRESEFKKPAHTMAAPQNGRVHHRPYPYKNDSNGSSSVPAHRPPPLRIPNGIQSQITIDSSQPPIESILKEMKTLPTPLSVIAATPRKEAENKFIFNPLTNKVQENPQITNTDLKTPITKPGLDNRIPNSRRSVSPDVVNKDLGLSESDDEVTANSHRLGPPLSPIGSNSPSSGSSSPTDSETESSSNESSVAPPTAQAPAPALPATTTNTPAAPAQRSSWSLVNFAPPPAQPLDQSYDSGKELRHALADVTDKPSPISEMSDSDTSSPSPEVVRRRRSIANRISTASSDEDTSRHDTTSPHVVPSNTSAPLKRGRPPKMRGSDERPPKKKRGRPPKTRPPSPPPATAAVVASPRAPSPPPDSDVEPDPPPQHHHTLQDTKTHIFRKVFTPKKGDECGGKGGKGGKGKGGKGKGQVTIIEVTAPETGADDDERRNRERSKERRNEEALARVSPPREPESVTRRREADRIAQERIQERIVTERAGHRRSADRVDRSLTERTSNDRIPERTYDRIPMDRPTDRIPTERTNDRIPNEKTPNERVPIERTTNDRLSERMTIDRTTVDRISNDRVPMERTSNDRHSERMMIDRIPSERSNDRSIPERKSNDRIHDRTPVDRVSSDRLSNERLSNDRLSNDRLSDRIERECTVTNRAAAERPSISDRLSNDRLSDSLSSDRTISDRLSSDKSFERIPTEKTSLDRVKTEKLPHDRFSDKTPMSRIPESRLDRLSETKMSIDRLPENKMSSKIGMERLTENKLSIDRLTDGKTPLERVERVAAERYIRAEADVGSGLKSGRGSERLEEASSNATERRRCCLPVRVPLSRLRADLVRALRRPPPAAPVVKLPDPGAETATNHERSSCGAPDRTPIYFSYFERLPADALSDEERDHKYYLEEATRLRAAAEREQEEPLSRVMLYLESVLCFVLTGRVLELELDTKGAFTVYRETIEYIKSIHSMPQRFRASPHDTFNKLDILSLRVQALLYLRMFKMYNREVKEYNKIVHEYQQKVSKPALAESVSPLSPSPSPAGSVGSVGSGSASSGYCSLAHSVPAHAHQALLLLTKYYAFLYVAHDLWEQADGLCRLRANQDLFISVDRKCGPLSLSSTFRHLVQYVRYAISLLKNAQRE